MKTVRYACFAAIIAACSFGVPAAGFAAAPDNLPDGVDVPKAVHDYALDQILVVHNWILCVTQPAAESIARAGLDGPAAAQKVYETLAEAKSCGRFAKMGVQLHKLLYPGIADPREDFSVFTAEINIGVGWSQAFVVSDGTPAD